VELQATATDRIATPASSQRASRARTVAYWVFTALVAQEMVAATMWAFLSPWFVLENLSHLGYPYYLQSILGIWALPCALALMAPAFGTLKEWAYAGAFFDYSGAVMSHAWVGDGPEGWGAPLVFTIFTVASWTLRPTDRRAVSTSRASNARRIVWILTLAAIGMMVVIALITLPRMPATT
jgi:hypothetical protein